MADKKSVGKLVKQFKLVLGDNVPVTVEQLVNFAGTEQRTSLITVRPNTVSEIQKVVRAAVSLNLKVRAVGNGFASAGFPDNGQVAIYLDRLTRVDGGPPIELIMNQEDPLDSELTVLSNVSVQELIDFQLRHGVELLTNVLSRVATIGGIVSTATHGTGLHCKSVCDQIVRMRVVDATGELKTYDTSDMTTLNAVRGGLGLFGVIYDVTFKVSPLSIVQIEDRWIAARNVFYDKEALTALVHNNVSLELHWCVMNSVGGFKRMQAVMKKRLDPAAWEPHRDEVYVRSINRPPAPMQQNTEDWFENRQDPLAKIYKSKHWFTLKVPASTPIVTHKMVRDWKSNFQGTLIQTVPHAVHYFALGDPYPVWNMEFSFNLDADCTNLYNAIIELIEMLRAEASAGRFPVVKIAVRFTSASDVYLSPSYAGNKDRGGSGITAHIDIESFPGTAGWHQFAAAVALKWLQIPGARPHWGRQWEFVPGIINHLKHTCAEEITKFKQVLESKCQDHNRMFFTDFTEQLLYGSIQPLVDQAEKWPKEGAAQQLTVGSIGNGKTVWAQVNGQMVQVKQQPEQLVHQNVAEQIIKKNQASFIAHGQPQGQGQGPPQVHILKAKAIDYGHDEPGLSQIVGGQGQILNGQISSQVQGQTQVEPVLVPIGPGGDACGPPIPVPGLQGAAPGYQTSAPSAAPGLHVGAHGYPGVDLGTLGHSGGHLPQLGRKHSWDGSLNHHQVVSSHDPSQQQLTGGIFHVQQSAQQQPMVIPQQQPIIINQQSIMQQQQQPMLKVQQPMMMPQTKPGQLLTAAEAQHLVQTQGIPIIKPEKAQLYHPQNSNNRMIQAKNSMMSRSLGRLPQIGSKQPMMMSMGTVGGAPGRTGFF